MKTILIVVPSFKILGGVSNHYMGLNPHWKNNIHYSFYGKRQHIRAIFCLIPDLIAYLLKLIFLPIDIVIVNPSLRSYQLKRDGIYATLALMFKKKLITFIHGWDNNEFNRIKANPSLFQKTYGRSIFIYTLCSDFKNSLSELNLKCPILLTTTKVADNLISDYDIKKRKSEIKEILFLARIEKEKGIFIAIDTFKILKEQYPYLKLSICGTGSALEDAKIYANGVDDITFFGNVSGVNLKKRFEEADVYILPTYGEGMATSILESMAFGLPIISRPVGGIKDFFVNGEMGYLTESINPSDYAVLIKNLIENPSLINKINHINYNYATTHFLASSVTKRFENDIETYFNSSRHE